MSTLLKIAGPSLDEIVQAHRVLNRTHAFKELGPIVKIGLEVNLDHPPTPRERLLLPWIDYYQRTPKDKGPILALSLDDQSLLLPWGVKPFPDVPDPLWTPGCTSPDGVKHRKCPMIPQDMAERAESRIEREDGTWVLFQPVTEIWYRVTETIAMGVIRCREFCGTHTCLAINADTCEAFFYGGAAEPRRQVLGSW